MLNKSRTFKNIFANFAAFLIFFTITLATNPLNPQFQKANAKGRISKFFHHQNKSPKIKLIPRNSCGGDSRYLVFEEKTLSILSQQNSSTISYPASLVKLMTLYLTFEAIKKHQIGLNQKITISEYSEEISKINRFNSLKLKIGDKISVKEAIEAVIVKSYNEAAVALAEIISGDEWNFARKMNEKAAKLGMINSSFRNSSGLFAEGQYTTAIDLAKLAFALKRDFPEFYHFFKLKKFMYQNNIYESHNRVLLSFKGAEGMKTGYIRASGFNLISSASRQGKRIFGILIGCESSARRDGFMIKLLESGFYELNQLGLRRINIDKISKVSIDDEYVDRYHYLDDEKEKFLGSVINYEDL